MIFLFLYQHFFMMVAGAVNYYHYFLLNCHQGLQTLTGLSKTQTAAFSSVGG
jgi:hypothetical protein